MRLNLGSGPGRAEGWVNVDREQAWPGYDEFADMPADWQGDFIVEGLPYKDGTFDYAVAHHTLQMVKYVDLPQFFAETHRVLRPGGTLRMSVPAVSVAFDMYIAGDVGWFPIVDDAETSIGGKVCAYATWYSEARTLFTPAWLTELCHRHGFVQTAVCYHNLTVLGPDGICDLDSRPLESIYVEAQK